MKPQTLKQPQTIKNLILDCQHNSRIYIEISHFHKVMSTGEEEKTKVTAISWTGGKDCNLALLYAKRNSELDVKYLLTFRPKNGGKSPFRAHPIPMMEAQAKSLGLELIYVMLSEPEEEEDKDWMKAYVDGITKIKHENGIEVICSGDIDLVGTMKRNWIEECCEKAGIESYLPLWKKNLYPAQPCTHNQ